MVGGVYVMGYGKDEGLCLFLRFVGLVVIVLLFGV